MKAFKRMATTILSVSVLSMLALTIYNSAAINNDSFMSADLGSSFHKRLDEIDGKVIVGRMAASTRKWTRLERKAQRKQEKALKAIAQGKFRKAQRKLKKSIKAAQLEPTIKSDMDLQLSSVFHKKPLKKGSFTGSARTVDGVIEEILVNLPNGNSIEINTYDRMVGNVFQYDDGLTGERKSGMLYESGKNKFTVVLTNDSTYQGMKLEFTTNGGALDYNNDYYNNTQSWEADKQNNNPALAVEEALEPAQEETEYVENDQVEQNDYAHNFNS